MKTVIIIPTYNERDNIGRLITALHTEFESIDHDMQILVVDDNSPDNTADEVKKAEEFGKTVHLIQGEKNGLGAAYIRGMTHALDELGAEVVFEMDADFSHKPSDVKRLMDEIDYGADFVIGSRYVKGGTIPENWGFHRKMNSFCGNLVARYVAGIYKVKDCTAGFRAIRASLLKHIDLTNLKVQGYAFQVALLHKAVMLEANIVEIPVDFIDRTEGDSKLGLGDIIEFILNVWGIRLRNTLTFFKFAAVGASGTIVNLGVFTLLVNLLNVNKYVASPVAIEVSILSNFLLNNFWTFKERETKGDLKIKGLKFNLISILSLLVSFTTFVLLCKALPDVMPQIHQFLGIIPATFVNYFLNSYWTFRHAPEAAEDES